MHELLVDLYPWILGLWLLDAVAEPRRGHLLVVAGWRGGARLLRSGLGLVGLSPLDEVVALHDLPGLHAGTRRLLRGGRGVDAPLVRDVDLEPFEAAAIGRASRVAKRLVSDGRTVLVAPSAEWAEALRARLAAAPAGGGDGVAAEVEAARALRARQRPYLAVLRVLALALAAGALGLWPAVAWAPAAVPVTAGGLLAALGALVVLIAATGAAMIAACGEGGRAALGAGLHLLAYPVAALRPLGHLSWSLYRRFEAAATLAALLPPAELARWGALELARARASREATSPELAPAWEARAAVVRAALAAAGLSEAEVTAPPPAEKGAAGWCPLCRAQYRAGFACRDCGVAVAPFAGEGDGPRAAASPSRSPSDRRAPPSAPPARAGSRPRRE